MKNYTYYNTKTKETTTSASAALSWHKAGDKIEIWKTRGTAIINGATIESEQERFNRVEGRERCQRIAEEIEAYADGKIHRCPYCDEIVEIPTTVGDKFRCPHCEEVNDIDDFEELDISDYLDDILDIDFIINRFKKYRACEICIAWGGPNIYIDTADAYIKLYWGNTREKYPLSYRATDLINDWAEDYYNCL